MQLNVLKNLRSSLQLIDNFLLPPKLQKQ